MNSHKQDTLAEAIEAAVDLMAKLTVPLYQDHGSRPWLIGSCFFVRYKNQHFVVSAAHVFDHLDNGDLYYYISPKVTRKLTGTLLKTRFSHIRDNDMQDVGVIKLDGDNLPPYSEVEKYAVDFSYLLPSTRADKNKNYVIVGFPETQNRANPIDTEIKAIAYAYHNQSLEAEKYAAHGCSPESHIILPLKLNRAFNLDGTKRSFPKPQGMSGSPIWVLYEEEKPEAETMLRIVGIGMRYRATQNILIGTNIKIAVDMMDALVSQ